jgi:cytochrome P450
VNEAPEVFDPRTPGFLEDPYPLYARFRARDRVHWSPHPSFPELPGCWYLFGYAEVAAALRDPRARRERPPGFPTPPETPLSRVQRSWMVMNDPPEHTRLRAPAARGFSPRAVARLRPRIVELAGSLLDGAGEGGHIELMSRFAKPLPDLVLGEMFGMPREDLPLLEQWTPHIVRAVDKLADVAERKRGMAAAGEMAEYIRALVAERVRAPRDDLVSELAAGEGSLSREEVVGSCLLLLMAGHETTSNLIGNAVLALLRHPRQAALLRADPSLVPGAVEELMRYDGTAQMVSRIAHEEMEIGGKLVAPGDGMVCVLGSANRDSAQFPDPDRLDVTRADVRHLGLGHGIHYCVGAGLGRLTAAEGLRVLLERFPRLELAGEPVRRPDIVMRGLQSLPLSF